MSIADLLKIIYNVGIAVPLTLETVSRMEYVLTGKYNTKVITFNKVAYDVLRNVNEFSKSQEVKKLDDVFNELKKKKMLGERGVNENNRKNK